MASPGNEPEVNGGGYQSHHSSNSIQTHGMQSLESDLLSDPSRLISLILNGADHHGISHGRRQERHRLYSQLPQEEVLNKLIDKEYEAKRLMKVLRAALSRLNSQKARISELEHEGQEALERLRQINQSRIQAQQQASRTEQELRIYRAELDNARRELIRGQGMIRTLKQQRDEAEHAAVRARAKARKLRQQRLVDAAREEGRRWGFHDGYERAKNVVTPSRTTAIGAPLPRNDETGYTPNIHVRQDVEDVENEELEDDGASALSSTAEIIQQTEVRPPSTRSASPEVFNSFTNFDYSPRLSPSVPQPQMQQPEPQPSEPPPPMVIGRPGPGPSPSGPPALHPDARGRSIRSGIESPSLSIFPVDFADAQRELGGIPNPYGMQFGNAPRSWAPTAPYYQPNLPQKVEDPRYGPPPEHAGSSQVIVAQRQQSEPLDEKKKASWYRTFSLRKRFGKRRVIDPEPGEEMAGEAPSGDVEEEEIYEHQRAPSISWYQPKGTSIRGSLRRPSSVGSGSTSTHMSQLQLIKTPAHPFGQEINASNPSLTGRSIKDPGVIKKLKEKLSIINENPVSREATPTTERPAMPILGIPRMPSSSTMNSQALAGPLHSIGAAFSDSRYPQFRSTRTDILSKLHRSASNVTPPVTIEVQTPSGSQPSDDHRRNPDELPNRFLSPSPSSQRLSSVQQHPLQPDTASSRSTEAHEHRPSRQTSAMNVKERYLARTIAQENPSRAKSPPSSVMMREPQGPPRPPSRQTASPRPGRAGSTPLAMAAPLPIPPGSPNGPTLTRRQSNISLQSMGSYSKFDPSKYVDPAFFESNVEPNPGRRDVSARPGSSASHLSYVTEKRQ